MIKSVGEQALSGWLDDMAEQPLPGGVSAAALAAAMGTALVAKAALVTLRHKHGDDVDQHAALESLVDCAREKRPALVGLVEADEQAYQAVLDAGEQASEVQAWQTATEVPVGLAEISQSILANTAFLDGVCWPAVRVDLEIGITLLEVGMQAGLRAAEANLRRWGDRTGNADLQLRIETLKRQALEEVTLG